MAKRHDSRSQYEPSDVREYEHQDSMYIEILYDDGPSSKTSVNTVFRDDDGELRGRNIIEFKVESSDGVRRFLPSRRREEDFGYLNC